MTSSVTVITDSKRRDICFDIKSKDCRSVIVQLFCQIKFYSFLFKCINWVPAKRQTRIALTAEVVFKSNLIYLWTKWHVPDSYRIRIRTLAIKVTLLCQDWQLTSSILHKISKLSCHFFPVYVHAKTCDVNCNCDRRNFPAAINQPFQIFRFTLIYCWM